jgi:hypothetical protein
MTDRCNCGELLDDYHPLLPTEKCWRKVDPVPNDFWWFAYGPDGFGFYTSADEAERAARKILAGGTDDDDPSNICWGEIKACARIVETAPAVEASDWDGHARWELMPRETDGKETP